MQLKYLYYLGVIVLLAGFILLRPINYDEAFYLMSSNLVLNGKLPYKDFLFHQTPLIIYVYSVISNFGYISLILGRCLSVFFFIVSYLIFGKLLKDYEIKNSILLFSSLFFLNTLILNWIVVIKIYALSILLLTSGLYFFKRFITQLHKSDLILCSLFFSFLVLTKIVFVVNLMLFVIFIIFFVWKNYKKMMFETAIVVTVSILLPIILFFLILGNDPGLFYFNIFKLNFIFKQSTDESLIYTISKYFLSFLLPQNFILVIIILFSGFRYTMFEKFMASSIILFFIVHFVTLMLPEYMVSMMPLLVFLAVLRYDKFVSNVIKLRKTFTPKRIFTTIVLLYIFASPFSLEHLKYLIENRPLVLNPVQMYGFEKRINEINGTRILSSWDGYSIFSNKAFLFTNDYLTFYHHNEIDDEEIARKYLREPKDYELMIISKEPDVIVYDRNNPLCLTGQEALIAKNYKVAFEYKYIVVYRKI